jgi:P27 family predicted phage terminase small subunit
LKLLRGETKESRLNRDAPKPDGVLPPMPRGMSVVARRVWRRQTQAMRHVGLLTVVDVDSLRAYCEAVDRYVSAAEFLASSGPLVRGARGGDLVKNPLHQVVRDNAMLIRLFARDLGFLPSAREGIHVPGADDDGDAFAAWAAGDG